MENEHEDDASTTSPANPEAEFKRYCERESNEAYSTIVKGQEEYDKQLLTLSTGLLAVLIAFLKDVVRLDSAIRKSLLYSGFAALGLTIICVIASFQVSIFALERVRDYWKRQYDGEHSCPFPDSIANSVKYINWAGGLTFVVGVVLVFLFITFNLSHQSASGGTSKPKQPTKNEIIGAEAETGINSILRQSPYHLNPNSRVLLWQDHTKGGH